MASWLWGRKSPSLTSFAIWWQRGLGRASSAAWVVQGGVTAVIISHKITKLRGDQQPAQPVPLPPQRPHVVLRFLQKRGWFCLLFITCLKLWMQARVRFNSGTWHCPRLPVWSQMSCSKPDFHGCKKSQPTPAFRKCFASSWDFLALWALPTFFLLKEKSICCRWWWWIQLEQWVKNVSKPRENNCNQLLRTHMCIYIHVFPLFRMLTCLRSCFLWGRQEHSGFYITPNPNNLINKRSAFSILWYSRGVRCFAQKKSGATWGSWPASVGLGPSHISPVVDVEEKDAAGSWLFLFLFFSLRSFTQVFWRFPATSCFLKLVCLWGWFCSAQTCRGCSIPAQRSFQVCAESETCVLKGFLQWGWSCVSFSPYTSCSFVRRNLESSSSWFFSCFGRGLSRVACCESTLADLLPASRRGELISQALFR